MSAAAGPGRAAGHRSGGCCVPPGRGWRGREATGRRVAGLGSSLGAGKTPAKRKGQLAFRCSRCVCFPEMKSQAGWVYRGGCVSRGAEQGVLLSAGLPWDISLLVRCPGVSSDRAKVNVRSPSPPAARSAQSNAICSPSPCPVCILLPSPRPHYG